MKIKLKECVQLVKDRTSIENVDLASYISTDNMLPNRKGVDFNKSSKPKAKTVLMYQKGDVLISNIRPYFKKIWMADRNGTRSGDILAFRVNKSDILQKYLYCILQSDIFFDYVMASAKGTKMPRGDKNAILDFEFEVPSIEKQKKVYKPILTIEKKINLNNKINTNLNSLLECIFNNYYHHKNDTVSTKLELISEVRSANRIFAKEYRNKGIPFLRGKEISLLSQGNSPTDTLFISIEKYKKLKNIPKAKDILVTSVGTIGNIYQVENFRLPFYYKDGNIIQITPHKGFENYIYLWLNSKFGDKEIVSATIGSTQKALTISAIKKFKLYILNNHELQRFNHIVNPLIKQIQQNHEENDFLQDLKSTLLKRYF
ncbi:restriction endonuclease subunit S [Ligilactobacillus salivarius]|uniref:restriction endonuclease subunit S n=1 Tax=Ligilactobacillus salivarius TaxID=1624 RepID=UPI003F23EB9C